MAINKKILLIDDNPHILEAMELILVMENYQVNALTRTDNIMHIVKTLEPDIILLDYLLSGDTGKHIAAGLKHNKQTKHIPIVIISAHPEAEKSSMQAGVDAFLAKPFEVIDLLSVIKRFTDGQPTKKRKKLTS